MLNNPTEDEDQDEFVASIINSFGRRVKWKPRPVEAQTGGSPDAHTVQFTLSGGTASLEGGPVSFTGVSQITPVRNTVTRFGNGPSASVLVTSAPGDMVVDVRLNEVNCNTAGGIGAQSTAAGAASVTMGYTIPADNCGLMGMDIVAAGQ